MKHTECKDCELSHGDCGHHFKMDGKTNYDIASLSACDKYGNCDFFKAKAKPKGDLISRKALKKAVCAEFGNSNLTDAFNDIIDGAPTIPNEYMRGYEAAEREYKRQQGKWIPCKSTRTGQITNIDYKCSECFHHKDRPVPYCEICGAKMKGGAE